MATTRKQWGYSPKKSTQKPQIPTDLKQKVEERAQALVLSWKEKHIQPPPDEPKFNYLIDLWTKWYRSYFYFGGTYACPHPNAIAPTFEVRYARIEYVGDSKFNLAYMRHNDQWSEIFTNLSLGEAFHELETGPHFQPV